ncbi:Ig-like domain-containing protein [Panacagrimonas perspica]|uniref:Ig-like domain-containing protein n=1 Tax=Panacagrimonas perspica TaxID=381431 RepID=UPI0013C2E067|nr:Ig-like domain-containing protein [Panacagrimonas perspica]
MACTFKIASGPYKAAPCLRQSGGYMGSHRFLRALCAALSALTIAGCGGDRPTFDGSDDGGGGTGSPKVAGINLIASSATLSSDADSAAEGVPLTAIAVNSGNSAVAGATVSFTASSGVIVVSSATTGADGSATATLHTGGDPTPRTITVTAKVGGATRSATIEVIPAGGGGPQFSTITLSPGSANLPSDADTSGEGLPLQAIVKNAANIGVAGVQVAFAATSGQLVGVVGTTNSDGIATATLTTGGDPTLRTVTVTASAGGQSDSSTINVVSPQAGQGVSKVTVISSNPTLANNAVNAANGVTITAIITDANNNAVSGVNVGFAATSGQLVNIVGTTDGSGRATAVLTTGGNSTLRTINITATVGTLSASLSPPIQVVNSAGQVGNPAAINLFSSSATLASTGNTQATGVNLTAVITDLGNRVVPGVPVTFTANSGAIIVTQGTTDASGAAQAVLTTGGVSTPRNIQVTATAGGFSSTINIQVIAPSGGPTVGAISLIASSLQLPSDADTAAAAGVVTLTALVRDANNNAVTGAPVTFSATSGQLVSISATSDANGVATAKLTTGGNPALRTISVTASAGGLSSTIQVQVVAGASGRSVAFVTLSTSSSTLLSTASSPAQGVALTATALDSSLNPIPGVTVEFAANAGALANIVAVTNANGQATAVLTTGGNTSLPPSITVSARVGTISDSEVIQVVNPVSNITLISSSPQLPSGAVLQANGITLTAIIKDSQGVVVAGIPVTFAAPGAAIQVTRGTTDASGTATAVLTTGGNPANRTVNVTASSSGGSSNTVQIAVVGTTLQINGPITVGAGQVQTYQVVLRDSTLAGIPGRSVTVTSLLNNLPPAPLNSASVVTDFNGTASFSYTGTNPGSDTLSADAGVLNATAALNLTVTANQFTYLLQCQDLIDNELPGDAGVDFGVGAGFDGQCASATDDNESAFIGDGPVVAIGPPTQGTRLRFVYTEAGVPIVGQVVSYSVTRGYLNNVPGMKQVVGAITGPGGVIDIDIRSNGSDGAGETIVSLQSASGSSVTKSVQILANAPANLDLQATPATIPVSGSSTLTAVVRDASNNLVANQRVDFLLTDATGGTLSAASAVTNSGGTATVTYRASTVPSATNGVAIAASIPATAITDTANITVGGQALFISLGTGNTVAEPSPTVYKLPYSAVVTDAAGNPAPSNTTFRLTVISVAYQKGAFATCVTPPGIWVPSYTVPGPSLSTGFGSGCRTEDVPVGLGNGILDAGEDLNTNGILDPGNVVTVPSTVPLVDGVADFDLTYPQDRAYWVAVTLKATASVAGSESVAITSFVLPGAAPDYADCTIAPPGQISPYGTGASCGSTVNAQCSDGVDNSANGLIDIADPGCHTDGNAANPTSYNPLDNSEALPQCSDGIDNDADTFIDTADPQCHTDGNAGNALSYSPLDNSEAP